MNQAMVPAFIIFAVVTAVVAVVEIVGGWIRELRDRMARRYHAMEGGDEMDV